MYTSVVYCIPPLAITIYIFFCSYFFHGTEMKIITMSWHVPFVYLNKVGMLKLCIVMVVISDFQIDTKNQIFCPGQLHVICLIFW
jgi:hypothetical protein